MTKKAGYYTLIEHRDGSSTILHLEPYTYEDCKRAIAWQERGGNPDGDKYHIVWWHPTRMLFVNACAHAFVPDRLPYTEKAWAEFMERLIAEE